MAQKQAAPRAKTGAKKKAGKSGAKSARGSSRVRVTQDVSVGRAARARRQALAVVLFAAAVLLLCILLIPGKNVWFFLHNLFFILFGVVAFLLPLILAVIAVIASAERALPSVPAKLWETAGLVLLTCSAVHIFTFGGLVNIDTFVKNILVKSDIACRGGGLVGFFGGLLYAAFGKVGAAVTVFLLIAVLLVLLTGTTLLQLFAMPRHAVRKTRERAARKSAEPEPVRYRHGKPKFNIDVPIDEHPPEQPKPSETIADIFSLDKPGHEEPGNAAGLDELVSKIAAIKEPASAAPVPAQASSAVAGSRSAAAFPAPAAPARQMELYSYPPTTLLKQYPGAGNEDISGELRSNASRLVDTLRSFGVETRVVHISRGPAVTQYELQPSAGVKISRITSLSDDIALNLAAAGVRIEAPIPNKAAVGIEVPNKVISIVGLRETIESREFRDSNSRLTVALGRDIAGNAKVADIGKMPHVLIAGATGSGKSVCINSIIMSLLYKSGPEDVRFLMVDPKVVELGVYNGIPHLLVPVVTDPRKAAGALNWAVAEMLKRYKLFADNNVRDIRGFNALAQHDTELEPLPQVVIIIDELADLMMIAPGDVEDAICRLAQMARAAGMHLVIATQRPSVDVITGVIKANIPSRIAFGVSSQVDSRTILDGGGAEKLLGRGDMLFLPVGASKPVRVQGCYVSDEEVEAVIDFIKKSESAEYSDEIMDEIEKQAAKDPKTKGRGGNKGNNDEDDDSDAMLPQAIECVLDAGIASTSLLQRRLKLGYARAARIIDQMEQQGLVGPFEGSKPRQVLISRQQYLEMAMNRRDES